VQNTIGPFAAATNAAYDIEGTPDPRPSTWGESGVEVSRITFKPPAEYRTRVLRAYGDVVAWTRNAPPMGKSDGFLFGLSNTGPDGSARADLAADNTFLYVQGASRGEPSRLAFDYCVKEGGLLQPDNVMVLKAASFLNDTGMPIHIEPSFIVVFQFERES
jgi:hypothetical protein